MSTDDRLYLHVEGSVGTDDTLYLHVEGSGYS